jgi:Na+-driven multidrug efflux pump
MVVVAMLLAVPLCRIFVGYDKLLYEITLRGFIIFSFSYLVTGFNIFGSSFFTALNNGGISAIISLMRTLVFQVIAVLILPEIFALDGVWFSIIVAELLSAALTTVFLIAKRKKYQY